MTPATAQEQRYLNYADASRYTGMSEQTLRRMVDAGRVRVYRPTGGRLVLFDVRELDAFVRGNGDTPAEGR
jgi:excisionase family DNA binding protein